MVIPRSRSAFSLSSIQAYLREPFPIWKLENEQVLVLVGLIAALST